MVDAVPTEAVETEQDAVPTEAVETDARPTPPWAKKARTSASSADATPTHVDTASVPTSAPTDDAVDMEPVQDDSDTWAVGWYYFDGTQYTEFWFELERKAHKLKPNDSYGFAMPRHELLIHIVQNKQNLV